MGYNDLSRQGENNSMAQIMGGGGENPGYN